MALPFVSTAGPIAALWILLQRLLRLEREQWLPAEELEARRRVRLQRLLARAAEAPYYRAVLRDAGITDPAKVELHDLERLPLLDRQVMAQHGLDAFLTVDGSDLFSVLTSGSTGTPGRFLRSKLEEADYSARWWRVYAAFGCRAWDAQVNVAIVNKPDRAGPITLMRRMGMLPRVERLASDTPPGQVLERVRDLTPPILTGYAGAIEALADHVLATGTPVQSPRAVFCTAMEVTDRCLELTEQAFRAPAVDVYVTNEFGVIAWSCPARRNVLHVNDDTFVVEIVGPDGKPVPPGTQGELVVTSLGLTSMPLIRYRMGDMAARLPGRCECGRGLGLLTRVQGRTAHAIRRTDGSLITTPLITSLLCPAGAHEWVRRFQVREEPGRRLRLLLDVRQAPSAAQWNRLTEMMESGVGPEFGVAIEIVDQIPAAPSGKLQFVVPLAKS
ncbi:MAG: phenylacetate--CoA ligase family protein [Gemmatimonadales bacterium]